MIDPLTELDLTEREQEILDMVVAGGPGKRHLKPKEILSAGIVVVALIGVATLYESGWLAYFWNSESFSAARFVGLIVILGFFIWNSTRPNAYTSLVKKCHTKIIELQMDKSGHNLDHSVDL